MNGITELRERLESQIVILKAIERYGGLQAGIGQCPIDMRASFMSMVQERLVRMGRLTGQCRRELALLWDTFIAMQESSIIHQTSVESSQSKSDVESTLELTHSPMECPSQPDQSLDVQ